MEKTRITAPQATVSQPTASSGAEVQQVRDHFGRFAPSRHEVPRWNQRKARKAARQTGRKIQKRYAR